MVFQILARRVAQVVDAYAIDAQRLAWHAVKHYTGVTATLDCLGTQLRSYVARRNKDEVELENMRSKSLKLPASVPAGDAAELEAAGALPGADRPAPKRRANRADRTRALAPGAPAGS